MNALATLLIIFNCVLAISPAFAIAGDGSFLSGSTVHQSFQINDAIEEVPVSATCVVSRSAKVSKRSQFVYPDSPRLLMNSADAGMSVAFVEDGMRVRPAYYVFVFRYTLF